MKTRIPVLFDYPVTRAVTIPYFTPIALGLGLLLTAFFILFGVISAGYELVTEVSGTYNLTTSGWYENLRLPEWFLPQSQCTASILKVGEYLATSGFGYLLLSFVDPSPYQYDGMPYSNNPLQNCSVQYLSVVETAQYLPGDDASVGLACNTSANQYINFASSRETLMSLNGADMTTGGSWTSPSGTPLNITSILPLWMDATLNLLQLVAPFKQRSILYPSLQRNNLSYLSLSFYTYYSYLYSPFDYNGEPANTPASGNWNLSVVYLRNNETDFNVLTVSFSSTGEIDTSGPDYDQVNALLLPSQNALGSTTDFWRIVNWLLVSCYWSFLAEFGQITPTTYAPVPSWVNPDFGQPVEFQPTNNIFVNETLFQIYGGFLRDYILPFMNLSTLEFQPLDDNNRLTPSSVTFLRRYICQVPQLKNGWYFAVFAVLFSLMSTLKTGVFFFVQRWEKRDKAGQYCEGCLNRTSRDLMLEELLPKEGDNEDKLGSESEA